MDYTDIIIPLRQLSRRMHLDSKRIQKTCGLSIPQLLTLTYLSRCEAFQGTQRDIRNYLHLNSSTMTGIVSRLVDKALIAKLPATDDKRATRLCLTAKGMEKLENTPSFFQERLTKNLAKLSEEKIKTIQTGLTLLLDVLAITDESKTQAI